MDESKLPTNICTTVGKKTHGYVEKCNLFSETTFLPYFMPAWCVFFYQSVYFFTDGVYHAFHHNSSDFSKTVLEKKYTPCQGMI